MHKFHHVRAHKRRHPTRKHHYAFHGMAQSARMALPGLDGHLKERY